MIKPNTEQRVYTFFDDPGHAWLEIPLSHLAELGIERDISSYSFQRGAMVYLEEDCDAGKFMNAARAAGIEVSFKEVHQDPTPIREYSHYSVN